MLKKFFISMLGTMAGLWISLALLIFGGSMFVGALIGSKGDSSANVEKKSVLHFNLTGEIAERYQPISFFDMIQMGESDAPTLEEMISALKAAAKDEKIEGLYLECNGSSMGTASRQELIEAIVEFKRNRKWVYAYSDSYSQGDYLIATTADTLALNPIGSVDIHGVGGMVPFYKGLLDKIGVKMQIIKVGTYKSAVEPYILTSMSEPARKQMQQYCDTIWNYISQTIAANRQLPESEVRNLASQMIFTRPADTFTADGLVDTLQYSRQANATLVAMSGIDRKDPRLITPRDYLDSKNILPTLGDDARHIAVLYAVGEISDSGDEGIVGSTMVKEINDLADDDDVAGLVLRVNSPGGSAFASEQIWEALEYFKSKDKPFYVSMGDYAASGGYYISCGADSIFADRTTITGSIGVFGMIPDFSGLLKDKLGVNFSTVETNENALGISISEPMTPAQYQAMQQNVENTYALFTSRVATGRNLELDFVKGIAEGRVWIGSDAIQLGLVDALGSLDAAVGAMADELGMLKSETKSYPAVEEKMWEQFLRDNADFQILEDAGYDKEAMRYIYDVRKLRSANPLQARMPKVIIK